MFSTRQDLVPWCLERVVRARWCGGQAVTWAVVSLLLSQVGCADASKTTDGASGHATQAGNGGRADERGGDGGQAGGQVGGSTLAGGGSQLSAGGARSEGGEANVGGQPGAGGQVEAGGESTGGSGGAGGSGGGASGGVEALIHYYGRWNQLADRAVTVNSGSHLSAQFVGTALQARFDTSVNVASDMPTLAWQIDDGTWQEADLAAKVSLGSGWSAGSHRVTLLARALDENRNRWSPPLASSITFLGFDVTDGALQPTARPTRPKLEFLGDSITEGVVIWKSYQGKSTQCWRNDARIAYPTQTAQLLGAEWRQVGFGFQGLLMGGDGGVPKANDSFNWTYKDVPRDKWQADMVVINEGTNDSSRDANTFRSAYVTYLATIRAGYPMAKLLALRPFGGFQAAQIEAAVVARKAAGDVRTYYVDTTNWLGSADFDGLHPNAQGSEKAAQALSKAITAIGLP